MSDEPKPINLLTRHNILTYEIVEDCWVFRGSLNHKGYGQVTWQGRTQVAHRVMYCIEVGPIPKDMLVCHVCDNRPCINPTHLFLGTNKDNHNDMVFKGRQVILRGSDLPQTTIAEDQVHIIRGMLERGLPTAAVARTLKISPHVVRGIHRGKNWKHVKTNQPA